MKLPTTNYPACAKAMAGRQLPTVAKGNKGFTLIEVSVSIFILLLGTLTIMGVISNSLKIINVSSQTTIAANLAQEGIEVVRNIRDTNWVQGEAYDTGITAGSYGVDYNSVALGSCGSNRLYWDGYSYNHDGLGSLTDFTRTITISFQTDSETITYIRVLSVVDWGNRSIAVETYLYDWK